MKKSLLLLSFLLISKLGFCQFPYTSYTFQVNNTCTTCCTASVCISFTMICPNNPVEYALITPTTGLPSYGPNPCFNNLCNGNYTINVSNLTSTMCAFCNISIYYNNPATAIELIENNHDDHFDVYPNPAKEYFKINSLFNTNYQDKIIEILNVHGKKLMEYNLTPLSDESYQINNLESGIYFVILSRNGIMLSRKRLVVLK